MITPGGTGGALTMLALVVWFTPETATAQANQTACSAGQALPCASVWSTPARGPATAPVTVLVFSDFESFPCARSATVLDSFRSPAIRLIFKHAPAATNPNALRAHEAALAAGAQGKFWEMHDLLFANQTKLSRADLAGYAKLLKLDTAAFEQALDNHTYRPIIERDLAEARGLGVATTPMFFINGRRMVGPQGEAALRAVIDSVLAGMPRGVPGPEAILSAGPAQAINLEQSPAKGPAGASVSLVEFSDFECQFCAAAASVVREALTAYPTRVRLAFKHYPLPFHKQAAPAHEAALAAGAQGKFWEMHDALFAAPQALARDDLIKKAESLKLDMTRFTADLDTHKYKAAVEADRQEGARLGVDGTPYFFINGHGVSGVGTLAEFKQLIDAALKEAIHNPAATVSPAASTPPTKAAPVKAAPSVTIP